MWKILEKIIRDELRRECRTGLPIVLEGACGRIVYKLLDELCIHKWNTASGGDMYLWGHPVVLKEEKDNRVNYCGHVS